MPIKHLSVYLNDHLAGSVTALELLANLAAAYRGTEVERLALEIRAEVAADRQELEALMDRLHVARTVSRRSAAWLAEKVTQLKLRVDDPGTGALRLLESIEAVSIGVEGKRLLWVALAAAAEGDPALRGADYPRLESRAEDQRRRLEAARREAARTALTASA